MTTHTNDLADAYNQTGNCTDLPTKHTHANDCFIN